MVGRETYPDNPARPQPLFAATWEVETRRGQAGLVWSSHHSRGSALVRLWKVAGGRASVQHVGLAPGLDALLSQDKGEVVVPVTITDASGESPIQAEMTWAWVPKKRA